MHPVVLPGKLRHGGDEPRPLPFGLGQLHAVERIGFLQEIALLVFKQVMRIGDQATGGIEPF